MLFEAKGLVKVFGKRTVVKDVSFTIDAGEVVGLLGKNGAGKTTTFRMSIGMIPATAGTVMFGGMDVTGLPMYRRARLGMGYLSQEPSAFRKLTVEENLLAILEILRVRRSERKRRLAEQLERFDLVKVARSRAYSLSGGERRRLEIARALLTNPKLLLLDEPFSGVDPIAVYDIQQIIASLAHDGIGVLLTDHNVRETLATTDRSYIINDGKVILSGTSDELVRSSLARKVYLGNAFRIELQPRPVKAPASAPRAPEGAAVEAEPVPPQPDGPRKEDLIFSDDEIDLILSVDEPENETSEHEDDSDEDLDHK